MNTQPTHSNQRGLRTGIVLLAFLLIAAFFLFTEHRAHLFGILPFLLVLASLFLYLFLHRGHESHGDGNGESGRPSQPGPHHNHPQGGQR